MSRTVRFATEEERRNFAALFTVFVSSAALPQSMEDLSTAAAIKRKCIAISDPHPTGARFDRLLRAGPQELRLKESEWEYLLSRLRPPAGQWTNFGADEALAVLELLKELPLVPDLAPEPETNRKRKDP